MTSFLVCMGTELTITTPLFSLTLEKNFCPELHGLFSCQSALSMVSGMHSGTCIKIWTNTMTLMDEQKAKDYHGIGQMEASCWDCGGGKKEIKERREGKNVGGRKDREREREKGEKRKEGCFQFVLSNITLKICFSYSLYYFEIGPIYS